MVRDAKSFELKYLTAKLVLSPPTCQSLILAKLFSFNSLWVSERVGFEPTNPSPINNLGLFRVAQTSKSSQNRSIRYKTGTVKTRQLRGLPSLPLHRLMQIPISL